ncbi:MAG: hypothetical protein ACTSPY_10475 [Candidatus Helarchaeota archaeon]
MRCSLKLSKWSTIIVLVILTPSITFLSYLIFSNSQNFILYLVDCINLKKSIFFQSIPNVNILWFLPKQFQLIPLSLPQLIDILFIIIIILCAQIPLAPTVRRFILIKEYHFLFDIDLYFQGKNNEIKKTNLFIFEKKRNNLKIDNIKHLFKDKYIKNDSKLYNNIISSQKNYINKKITSHNKSIINIKDIRSFRKNIKIKFDFFIPFLKKYTNFAFFNSIKPINFTFFNSIKPVNFTFFSNSNLNLNLDFNKNNSSLNELNYHIKEAIYYIKENFGGIQYGF